MTGIDRAGTPFIGVPIVLAAAAAFWGSWWLAAPFVLLAAFMAFFFRDPDRRVSAGPAVVLSPADGRVMVAGPGQPAVAPDGDWQQISIFLSPMDVHINRVPFGGRLTRVTYQPGRFLPAYRTESGAQNERTELWVEREGRTVVFRQVVGVLARRVVCRVQEGDVVETGDRFGLMKFGSRMDVFVAPDARLLVKAGDVVRAGETPLAELAPAQASATRAAAVETVPC
jgi:phosphatidylserine decarboxylase